MTLFSKLFIAHLVGDWLLQTEATIPWGNLIMFAGALTHLGQQDAWLRSGVRYPLGLGWHWSLGVDIFGGLEDSYFGEWRSNDRIYTVFIWRMG